MLCEPYCLKNSGQQPENNHAKYHKKNGIEHGLVPFESHNLQGVGTQIRRNYSAE
jgi:hypothetical protein